MKTSTRQDGPRPPGNFEQAVLLSLMKLGDDAYGVTIRRELETSLERSVSFGAVYTTLDRLLEKGMISTWTGDPTPQRGGRAKKHFRIEARGIEALEQARKTVNAMWLMIPSGSVK